MLEQLNKYIRQHKLFAPNDKILLAVSGGIDSFVMLDLFSHIGAQLAVIHCNFSLRGKESDEDEKHVKYLAAYYKIPVFTKKFNTEAYANEHSLSIQMAARELRYAWFEEIRKENGYDYIATAHNKNDLLETFFINLSRGTGIKGLTGIKPKNGKIIRPLIFASREDIERYCTSHELSFREDSSNAQVKYKRNKIRHQIIPAFQELNPDFIETMYENIARLKDVEEIYSHAIEKIKQDIMIFKGEEVWIEMDALKDQDYPKSLLYEILGTYNFSGSVIHSVYEALFNQPGKIFYSRTHQLVRDRAFLIISKINESNNQSFEITTEDKLILYPIELKMEEKPVSANFSIPHENSIACLDAEKVHFPLLLRKWQQGDFFYPLGMTQKKKLSDFFVDQKIPLHEKDNIWLLESNGEIAWVIGHRIDNRFKITGNTRNAIIFSVINKE